MNGDKRKRASRPPRPLGFPRTRTGWWSPGFIAAFLILFGAWLTYVTVWDASGPTFFSDPLHAVLILSAAAAGILGAFVLYWTVAEVIGH